MPVRVLLDEWVPRQLRDALPGLAARTVQEMGWAGFKNGALNGRAATEFVAIFTVDRDFGSDYRDPMAVGLVILDAGTTDATLLRPHMPAVVTALSTARPGQIVRVGA